ncbi:MAG: pyridoxamine 5'-phosphate oxidase family protein [Campylobacterales bacterium]|nr:pyridoxamine 5'-phosphate oxidase family protein [Campylobacterales bacterium]
MPERIAAFIAKHHILTLATSNDAAPQCATLFYVFDPERALFVVASDPNSEHMRNALANPQVAGAIALETKSVGKIQGLQFKGELVRSDDEADAALYYRAFGYARVMRPTFWRLHVSAMKLTDNTLGFGTKITWPS